MPHTYSAYSSFKLPLSLILLLLALSAASTTTVIHAQAGEQVVAVVNGRSITQGEVDKSIPAQLIPLQQQIYALRKATLENLIIRAILADEAKKRGISVEQLKREFTAAKVAVQQSDVDQSYAENRSAFGAMSEDEAKERIRLDLESHARMQNYRAALSRLEQGYRIERRLEEPALPLVDVVEGNSPSLGGKEAAVTIIEFSDFQCPFCKDSQSTLKKVLQTYGNNVRLVFKHLPLEIHSQALSSARASFCAGEQDKFWQYHDALFASDNFSPEAFNKMAADLGLDLPSFKKCFDSELSRASVLNDVQEAKRLGINGTPTFIVNGTLVRGAHSFDDFAGIIARQLKTSQPTITHK
jgi:protein-disulfide isomerase